MTNNTELGMFDVKTHFSEVVDRVLREGRPITVTRRGKPVVDIVPTAATPAGRMTVAQVLAARDELNSEVEPIGFDEIKAITDEGRRRWPSTQDM